MPPDQVLVRAVIGGYLLAWMSSVTVWRQLVSAELKAAIESGRATMEPPGPPPPRPLRLRPLAAATS